MSGRRTREENETRVQSSLGSALTEGRGNRQRRRTQVGAHHLVVVGPAEQNVSQHLQTGKSFQRDPMASGLGLRLHQPAGVVLPVVVQEARASVQASVWSPHPTQRPERGAQPEWEASPPLAMAGEAPWSGACMETQIRVLGPLVQASFCHPQ